MSYTARQVINEAYYITGIVSKDFQTLTGAQLESGLSLLNDVLAVKTADIKLIPYFKEYLLNAVVGQEMYFIPNLVDIETITFNMGDIRYPTDKVNRKTYFGSPRADNIISIPINFHAERLDEGSNIYLYPKPVSTYPMKVWGKFALASVPTENIDLDLTYERYYIVYLKLVLASYICMIYSINLQPQAAKELQDMELKIANISPKDYTMQKVSVLGKNVSGFTFADANIGKGFRPPQSSIW